MSVPNMNDRPPNCRKRQDDDDGDDQLFLRCQGEQKQSRLLLLTLTHKTIEIFKNVFGIEVQMGKI